MHQVETQYYIVTSWISGNCPKSMKNAIKPHGPLKANLQKCEFAIFSETQFAPINAVITQFT